ncbi:MAG TPA: hypothetical protein VMA95_01520 [Streptosporangiaceae bacterium]|nr:hypothetical protein [Streptosporangiaceae bacterium]
MPADYANPVQQFRDLMFDVSAPPAALQPVALSQIMEDSGPDRAASALAEHIAKNSRLDLARSTALVQESLPADGDTMARATAVSNAALAATSFSGEIELHDPVMLWPWARLVFSFILVAALIATIIFIFVLGHQKAAAPTATYVCLAVGGGLALAGLLIMVMGYKNVTIKGSK